jgi:hypothetical protein
VHIPEPDSADPNSVYLSFLIDAGKMALGLVPKL